MQQVAFYGIDLLVQDPTGFRLDWLPKNARVLIGVGEGENRWVPNFPMVFCVKVNGTAPARKFNWIRQYSSQDATRTAV